MTYETVDKLAQLALTASSWALFVWLIRREN